MKKCCALVLLILFIFPVCTQKEDRLAGEQGGTMVIGTTDMPTIISPLSPSMFGSNDILDLLFMRMHRVDAETGKMKPELASSWEFSEDLTSVTYYLRKNLTWWDGEPVTAEDVYYTYEVMRDPATQYPNAARLRFIKNVEIVGTHAVKFSFDRVYADLLTDSDIMVIPKHLHEEAGEGFGIEVILGNGPYQVVEWIPGETITLLANEDYYRGKPPLDEIIIQHYDNIDDMVSDFITGDLDVVLNITPEHAGTMQANENIAVDAHPGNTYTYIGWNLEHPFLNDRDVRRAISMAIDTDKILNDIFSGMGTVSLGPLPPTSWGYDGSIPQLSYDVSEAQRILREKGFLDRNRNAVIEKDGEEFVLTILTNRESPERVRILELVAADLRRIGVRVNTQYLSTEVFIRSVLNKEFDGFVMGWSIDEKIDPAIYWSSETSKGIFNFVSYNNSKVDSLMDVGVAMVNRKKAREIWSEFQKTVYNDQPYTFLIVADDISAYYKRVKGVESSMTLTSAYTYYIPEAERRVSVAALSAPTITDTVLSERPAVERSTSAAESLEEKPPQVVTPEQLLEAAARKETTIVVQDTAAAEPAIIPAPPPKPSVITKATPVKQIAPKYPESARTVGATGRVVVRVVVGTDGKVRTASIVKSFGNPACEAAALTAAQQWEFTPATKDGVPFEQQLAVPFDFRP
jgi:peptide/nickel transport system substrate-binding protein